MKQRAWVGGILFTAFAASVFAHPTPARPDEPPPIEHPPSKSPDEAQKLFKVPEGFDIRLVVSEPEVSQPLSVSFDERGRMWVLQYLQYPIPAGLKPVQVDKYLRTKYDKVPEPPPRGAKGKDRLSIYEDQDGDGRMDTVKHFLTDLNLGSGMALGYDGVFIVQPPYLLFYPDKNHDDVPDSEPEVLLKGFGMEDAHAFANSLTWGPDGWLYGAQGSTVTADIRGIGFQQGIWRYHPVTKEFELFAEGGGNTWGIDFDRYGNLFAGGNTVEPLCHHVQGAYYVKGFGKHGPLHNPHAYGYFQPVRHHGFLGTGLTGGFVIYQGGAFPDEFTDAWITPNIRQSATRWGTLEVRGSTFDTRAGGDFITTSDIWYRPVDSLVGPDGALYVCDWYDYNISHTNPQNRGQWYMPSRFDGRVWRVAPRDLKPMPTGSFDLSTKSSEELLELLSHPNDWYAREARRILAERRDASVLPALKRLALESKDQRMALQGLWGAYVTAGLDEEFAARALNSPHNYVRAWTVRLLGDAKNIPASLESTFVRLAADDPSVVVRSQLACTAKRLPAAQAMPIVAALLRRSEDASDEFVPLLIWWAIEDKAISDSGLVLNLFESPDAWDLPLIRQVILERVARRFAAEDSDAGYALCAELLSRAPRNEDVERIVAGFVAALSGRRFDPVPEPLKAPFIKLLEERPSDPNVLQLGLRFGSPEAAQGALRLVGDRSANEASRLALIRALGEVRNTNAIRALVALLVSEENEAIQSAAVAALGYFDDPSIADAVLSAYGELSKEARARSIELLCGRKESSAKLLAAVIDGKVPREAISLGQLRQILEHGDPELEKTLATHFGRIQPATAHEKQGRIRSILEKLNRGKGDPARGLALFEKNCATCHKLYGKGNEVGPDLTAADRKNRERLVGNIVDPSAMIREQFIAHIAVTVDGRVLTGLLAESTDDTVTILDEKAKRTVLRRDELEELRESSVSLMPEKILDPLSDQEIRDLFALLESDSPPTEASAGTQAAR